MFSLINYVPQRKVFLFLGDLLIVTLSIPVSYILFTGEESNFQNLLNANQWIYFSLVFVWMVLLFLNRAYHVGRVTDWTNNAKVFTRVAALSTLLLGFVFFLVPDVVFSKRVLVGHGIMIMSLAVMWRIIFSYLVTRTKFRSPTLIIGAGPAGELIAGELLLYQNLGFHLIGFIDDKLDKPLKFKVGRKTVQIPVLGKSKDLSKIARDRRVRILIDATYGTKGVALLRAISSIEMGRVKIFPGHHLYEFLTAKIPIKHVEGSWLVFDEFQPKEGLGEVFNRILNFSAATVGLILSLPITIPVVLAIALESKGPVIYKQKRVGLGGKEFIVYKFRSMKRDAENGHAVWAKKDDPRMTRVGRIIRKLRFDEIPQLVNIWKGEMNLVGPRPERPEFVKKLEKEIPFYQKRHMVRPGITGWAQVKYAYASSAADALEKLQYELYYIKRRSLLLDFIIILKTIDVVLTGRGR